MPDLIKWSASVGRTVNNLTWSVEGFSAPLIFPPGEAWMYGSSIDWAGLALEKVTGKTLGAYLDENIFKPLGMANTTFWPRKRDDLKDRLAVITFRPVSGNGNGEGLIAVPDPTPVEHEMESGGAGLYSTLGDYTRFVSALLRGDKILFQLESTRELLFAPQLDDVQRASMEQVVEAQRNIFAPDLPSGTPIDFGFGGMINTADVAGRRRKGSVMWSGMANAHWWIDQESGVAGVLFVTVLRDPPGDPVAIKLYRELEEAVYADLVKH
jgi:CubicO group peptidase (beta-lactamase class C family)